MSITGGSTTFGSGTSTVGYLTGSGKLNRIDNVESRGNEERDAGALQHFGYEEFNFLPDAAKEYETAYTFFDQLKLPLPVLSFGYSHAIKPADDDLINSFLYGIGESGDVRCDHDQKFIRLLLFETISYVILMKWRDHERFIPVFP